MADNNPFLVRKSAFAESDKHIVYEGFRAACSGDRKTSYTREKNLALWNKGFNRATQLMQGGRTPEFLLKNVSDYC